MVEKKDSDEFLDILEVKWARLGDGCGLGEKWRN